MGVPILDYAAEYGIGISQLVSVGNKTDVSPWLALPRGGVAVDGRIAVKLD